MRHNRGENAERGRASAAVVVLAAVALLAAASGAFAQDPLRAKLEPTGEIRILRGDTELALIDLNAHGPQWTHAPQATATAQASDLPDKSGKRFVGTLPIPNTSGGIIRFTETVKVIPQGLRLEYDISAAGAVKLNGLQLSVGLAVAQYAGKQLAIAQYEGDPVILSLPAAEDEKPFSGWSGEGSRVAVGAGTADELVIELRAPTDAMVQDLRPWKHPTFEVRFPAIMEDAGRDMTAEDRFHLDLTVTCAAPLKLEGP